MIPKYQKAIDFLLENANPSIKLRVKKEILGSITAEEEAELQSQILQEKIICFMAEKQQENGWIGFGFHGSNKNAGQYDNQETATKYMGEKGLKGTPVLDRAKSAEYKPRSYLPKYEIEAIVRTFFPAVAAFFETEEGNREFEEWKAKKEAEKNAKEKTA